MVYSHSLLYVLYPGSKLLPAEYSVSLPAGWLTAPTCFMYTVSWPTSPPWYELCLLAYSYFPAICILFSVLCILACKSSMLHTLYPGLQPLPVKYSLSWPTDLSCCPAALSLCCLSRATALLLLHVSLTAGLPSLLHLEVWSSPVSLAKVLPCIPS